MRLPKLGWTTPYREVTKNPVIYQGYSTGISLFTFFVPTKP